MVDRFGLYDDIAGICLRKEPKGEYVKFEAFAELEARAEKAEAERDRHKMRADNHAETLRGVRQWIRAGDTERALLWVSDGLSGYTETAETTLATAIDRAEKVIAGLNDQLTKEIAATNALGKQVLEMGDELARLRAAGTFDEGIEAAASTLAGMGFLLSIGTPEDGPFTQQDRTREEVVAQGAAAIRAMKEGE